MYWDETASNEEKLEPPDKDWAFLEDSMTDISEKERKELINEFKKIYKGNSNLSKEEQDKILIQIGGYLIQATEGDGSTGGDYPLQATSYQYTTSSDFPVQMTTLYPSSSNISAETSLEPAPETPDAAQPQALLQPLVTVIALGFISIFAVIHKRRK